MSRILPARLAPTRLIPYRLGGGLYVSASSVTLVDSPTRVLTPLRFGKVGDAIPIRETLKGRDGTAQNLTGATVVFSLRGPDGTLLVNRAPATIVSASAGTVSYTIPATTAIPAGLSTWEFEASWDSATVLSFPDDTNGTLTLVAEIA